MSKMIKAQVEGPRYELSMQDALYPKAFRRLKKPPKKLYVLGNPQALREGLAIVGARKATPYGINSALRFGRIAAKEEIVIISGGALGCDAAAHNAALSEKMPTVVFLGGGANHVYPAQNAGLFQRIVDGGGALVSEIDWDESPQPHYFRLRNRLIASLAKATLIVEAGLPSGTFSTADAALAANREVLVVPGSINSKTSRGANRLLVQGAWPVVDDDSFKDTLFAIFGCLRSNEDEKKQKNENELISAIIAEPMQIEEITELFGRFYPSAANSKMYMMLADAENRGAIAKYNDGRYGSSAN